MELLDAREGAGAGSVQECERAAARAAKIGSRLVSQLAASSGNLKTSGTDRRSDWSKLRCRDGAQRFDGRPRRSTSRASSSRARWTAT
eukprot:1039616-Rhodomonas_salina.2